ncbi:MAG: ribosome silencing factor [Candidatus Hydrogenedentes bacterium]|nr:ribosome silencing factor [Candidatus Hydrogenedentota bacterium]
MTNKVTPETKELLKKVETIAGAVADKKATHIKIYNMTGLTLLADVFILCSVTNEHQLKAVANESREAARNAGYAALRMEGDQHSGWLLVDFGDIILHVFREQARGFYDLDRMWGDAPEILLDLEIA